MIKQFLKLYQKTLHYAKFDIILRKLNKNKTKVLMYHSVNGKAYLPEYMKVSKKNFEKQILFLKKNYKILSYDEFISGERGVLLTFDDGFIDNYDFAFPILKKYNLNAIVFLIGEIFNNKINWIHKIYSLKKHLNEQFIETFNEINKTNLGSFSSIIDFLKYDCNKEKREKICEQLFKKNNLKLKNIYLTKKHVEDMSKLVEFGYHTYSHSPVSNLNLGELKEELIVKRKKLEKKLGIKLRCFSYPFGEKKSYDKESIKIIKKNFECAFSTKEGFYSRNKYEIERLSINDYGISQFSPTLEGSNIFFTNFYKKIRFRK